MPIEFFRKQYEDEIEVNLRVFIEQIYIARIHSLESKLVKIERNKRLGRSKSAAISDIFTSLTDIENIKRIVGTVKDKFFNSVGRLITRANTSAFNPLTQTLSKLNPFSDKAAMQRVADFGGYNAYNTATQSKLGQIDGGEQKVQYITARDEKVCEICRPWDARIFPVLDPEIPYLPQHEHCRCFLEAVIE